MTVQQPDFLGDVRALPRRRASDLAVALTALGAVTVAAAGVAVAAVLGSSGGAQPETVLPANAVAVLKLDLDPAADQKVAAYRLGRKFPELRLDGEDSVISDLVRQAVDSSGEVDYEKDVEPWLGRRIAIAAVPVDGEAKPLVALQVTDRDRARAGLDKLAEDEPLAYAFAGDDYVLLAETEAELRSASASADKLSDVEEYADALDQLEGNQVVTAWVDLAAAYALAPDELRESDAPADGHVVGGVHLEASYVELTGKAFDVRGGQATSAGREPARLVGRLPDDAVAALGISGLADGLQKAIENGPLESVVGELESELGVRVEDLAAAVGEDLAVAVLDGAEAPSFVARSRTSSADAGLRALQELLGRVVFGGTPEGLAEAQQLVRRTSDGLAGGSDAAAVDRAAAGGSLGETGVFRKAVPDAGEAGFVAYVDVQRALALADVSGDPAEQAKAVEAVGMSATASEGGNGSFRLRVTFR